MVVAHPEEAKARNTSGPRGFSLSPCPVLSQDYLFAVAFHGPLHRVKYAHGQQQVVVGDGRLAGLDHVEEGLHGRVIAGEELPVGENVAFDAVSTGGEQGVREPSMMLSTTAPPSLRVMVATAEPSCSVQRTEQDPATEDLQHHLDGMDAVEVDAAKRAASTTAAASAARGLCPASPTSS